MVCAKTSEDLGGRILTCEPDIDFRLALYKFRTPKDSIPCIDDGQKVDLTRLDTKGFLGASFKEDLRKVWSTRILERSACLLICQKQMSFLK